MVNHVTLVGVVKEDPRERTVNDKKVTGVTVVTESVWKDRVFREFHNVLAYGQSAIIATTLKHGDIVAIEGSIQSRSFDDAGQRRRVTEIAAVHVQRLALQPGPVAEREMAGIG
jgi:single stranded DNA-binding protein